MLTVRNAVLLLMLASSVSRAGEFAVLTTGFRIHAESHVTDGSKVTLQTDKGAIELPVSLVSQFELEEYAPPVPQPAAPASTAAPASLVIPTVDPKQIITEAARLAGLPPSLVHSLVRAESAYQTKAVSPKGAIGLMQLMPGTAAALKVNPYDVRQNIEAGVAYLRDLLVKYQNDPHQVTKAIAAYNAGPGAVDKYQGIPPYRETINYVNRVIGQYLKTEGQ